MATPSVVSSVLARRVPLAVLVRGDNPRRKKPAPEYVQQIADSMKKHDVIEPLIVRPGKKPDTLQIVCGETRYDAAVLANLDTVPVVERDYSDDDVLEVQLIENIQRNSMHPIDEGEAFKRLIDRKKHTVESLAQTIGKSIRWIYNRLEFTKLIPALRDAFLKGEITVSHAELLARLDPEDQKRIDNRPSNQGGYDSATDGLWRWDFLDLDGEDKKGTKRSARSIRDVDYWIEHNVRLNIDASAVQNLLPEIEDVKMEAARENARVLQVTSAFMVPQNPDLKKKFDGVLTERHWKRAGGKSACEFAERAVIVFGDGQGEVLDVCVNKKACAKHWPEHQPKAVEKRKAAAVKGSLSDGREAEARNREREKQVQAETHWKAFGPALERAMRAILHKLPAKVPNAILVAALKERQLPVVIPAELPRAIVRDVFGRAASVVYRSHHYEPTMRASAKALGVDIKAVEKSIVVNVKAMEQDDANTKPAKKSAATAGGAVLRRMKRNHPKRKAGAKK